MITLTLQFLSLPHIILYYIALGPDSSDQLKEERIENDIDEKPSSPEATSTRSHGEKADSEPDDSLLHAISAIGNAAYSRKPKSSRQASTDCDAVPTEKPEPTSGSSRRTRKPKVSKD